MLPAGRRSRYFLTVREFYWSRVDCDERSAVIFTNRPLLSSPLRLPSRKSPSPQVTQDSVSLMRQMPELPRVAWFSVIKMRSVARITWSVWGFTWAMKSGAR